MPWESIGTCQSIKSLSDEDWALHCHELAMSYLCFCLGDAPKGCRLAILWLNRSIDEGLEDCESEVIERRREVGDEPVISLHWDKPRVEPPWSFISACQALLGRFDQSVDWPSIDPSAIADVVEYGVQSKQ